MGKRLHTTRRCLKEELDVVDPPSPPPGGRVHRLKEELDAVDPPLPGDRARRLKEEELEAVDPPPPPPGGRGPPPEGGGVDVVDPPSALGTAMHEEMTVLPLGAGRACGADCAALGDPVAHGEGQASAGRWRLPPWRKGGIPHARLHHLIPAAMERGRSVGRGGRSTGRGGRRREAREGRRRVGEREERRGYLTFYHYSGWPWVRGTCVRVAWCVGRVCGWPGAWEIGWGRERLSCTADHARQSRFVCRVLLIRRTTIFFAVR
jgi:hypothetical protein